MIGVAEDAGASLHFVRPEQKEDRRGAGQAGGGGGGGGGGHAQGFRARDAWVDGWMGGWAGSRRIHSGALINVPGAPRDARHFDLIRTDVARLRR
jgi:hypothetical protein